MADSKGQLITELGSKITTSGLVLEYHPTWKNMLTAQKFRRITRPRLALSEISLCNEILVKVLLYHGGVTRDARLYVTLYYVGNSKKLNHEKKKLMASAKQSAKRQIFHYFFFCFCRCLENLNVINKNNSNKSSTGYFKITN